MSSNISDLSPIGMASCIKKTLYKGIYDKIDALQSIKNTLFQIFPEYRPIPITLSCIDLDGKKFTFAKPIVADVIFKSEGYFCSNDELGITITSESLEDCKKDFEEEILFIWNEYGKEDDRKLTEDAKQLKKNILNYIPS